MKSLSRIAFVRRGATCALGLSLGLLSLATVGPDQSTYNRKLSGPFHLPPTVIGSIPRFALTADGATTLFQADPETAYDFGLYRAATDGSTLPAKLANHGDGFRISGDGQYAVYLWGTTVYSVRVDGSAPPGALFAPVQISEFAIAPDSSRVVFLGSDVSGRSLRSAPITGGPSVPLGPTALPRDVWRFHITPDGQTVVYDASFGTSAHRLFRVPINGSSAGVEISPGTLPTSSLFVVDVTSTGHVLVLAAGHLYTVPLDGSSPAVQLDPLAGAAGARLSSDETRVLFVSSGVLCSALVDGSTPAQQLTPPPGPGAVLEEFALAPSGGFAVYRADALTLGQLELFRVPIDGSAAPLRLNTTLVAGGDVGAFAISPDGLRVVYHADQDALAVHELYSVPSSGGTPVRLNAPPVAGGDVQLSVIAADSTQVFYWADQDTDEVVELFRAPIDGSSGPVELVADPGLPSQVELGLGRLVYTQGDPQLDGALGTRLASTPGDGSSPTVALNPPLPLGPHAGDVSDFQLTPDGKRAVYGADQDVDEELELYCVTTRGGTRGVQLNAPLVAGGDVSAWRIAPDSQRVVYAADGDTDGVVELYGVRVDGSTPAVKLDGALVPGGNVLTSLGNVPRISSDSSRVVYLADGSTDEVVELYTAPIDGSAPASKLNASLPVGGDVVSMAITADATRVIYRADQSADGVFELFSAPIDASASAIRISAALAGAKDVTEFAVSPDAGRVAYRADAVTNDLFELFSVPADGSAPPVKLSGTLPSTADVTAIEIAPITQRVVYQRDNAGTVELYSAPLAGDGPPVKLSGALVAGGDVQSFWISPDGARVVYQADQVVDGRFEIFSVPSDGSTPALRLNGTLTSGSIFECAISPDSSRVAYHAKQDSTIDELYCVPIGGGASVRVSGGGTANSGFAFAPDGRHLLYLANEEVPYLHELYRVPVSGGTAPARVHPPLPDFGTIYSFAISSDGSRVLYRADQDQADVYELYGSQLVRGALQSGPP